MPYQYPSSHPQTTNYRITFADPDGRRRLISDFIPLRLSDTHTYQVNDDIHFTFVSKGSSTVTLRPIGTTSEGQQQFSRAVGTESGDERGDGEMIRGCDHFLIIYGSVPIGDDPSGTWQECRLDDVNTLESNESIKHWMDTISLNDKITGDLSNPASWVKCPGELTVDETFDITLIQKDGWLWKGKSKVASNCVCRVIASTNIKGGETTTEKPSESAEVSHRAPPQDDEEQSGIITWMPGCSWV
ncbi:uncharacterized protein I303_105511 [Kwoniella dejecticola CBS 10117]|uniref:Uncharacterized protein n=1 Tax=Kwoniella dejecticola CBS 10117 TaxID=1296121 RepID=A0A1A6A2A2_9TREE|nr:uncharacterized protein I303_05047 [Kwoniella dejecticola CBS 10117]OBR84190.1 hypothetical protein I303_05047 [Kwoniella dejecticola CBS 10117]